MRAGNCFQKMVKMDHVGEVIPCIVNPAKYITGASPGGLVVKNPPNAGDSGLISRWRRSPGGGNGNPCSILAWESPWTEKPGRLQSIALQRVRHNLVTEHY